MMTGGSSSLSAEEKIAWVRLTRTETIGAITFHRLLAKYKTASRALEAAAHFSSAKPLKIATRSQAEDEIAAVGKAGGCMIAACEDAYPLSLAAIEDAPPVLTVLGNPALLQKEAIGIVGSRNCSLNGRRFSQKLAMDLGQAGYVIASGLARGIDTAAHEGSLKGGTIAVVAGGADVVYPRENQKIYEQICEQGAVLSECAFGTQPIAQHFPKRNRIITGLSLGVVVVEANLKSGSLISARTAAEQGRDVFAVPGFPADPRSSGTNALIRDGATLVRSAEDILEQINSFTSSRFTGPVPYDPGLAEEAESFAFGDLQCSENARDLILTQLSPAPVGVDEIVRACQLRSSVVQGTLLELEISGLVQRLPGNRVCLL
jgi:DNA processing protein